MSLYQRRARALRDSLVWFSTVYTLYTSLVSNIYNFYLFSISIQYSYTDNKYFVILHSIFRTIFNDLYRFQALTHTSGSGSRNCYNCVMSNLVSCSREEHRTSLKLRIIRNICRVLFKKKKLE